MIADWDDSYYAAWEREDHRQDWLADEWAKAHPEQIETEYEIDEEGEE